MKCSSVLAVLLLQCSVARAQDHGEEASKEMGPVAFMWPPDREWGAGKAQISDNVRSNH